MIAQLVVGETYFVSSLRSHVIGVDQLIECILYRHLKDKRIFATAAATPVVLSHEQGV